MDPRFSSVKYVSSQILSLIWDGDQKIDLSIQICDWQCSSASQVYTYCQKLNPMSLNACLLSTSANQVIKFSGWILSSNNNFWKPTSPWKVLQNLNLDISVACHSILVSSDQTLKILVETYFLKKFFQISFQILCSLHSWVQAYENTCIKTK